MNGNQSVVGAICSSYDSYFEAEKKIADCIIERKEEVVDMTVDEAVAEEAVKPIKKMQFPVSAEGADLKAFIT